ncbi:MAG: flavodoxin family protein [Spirochaetes bacterium]|nr:flavodoxin family protein [Spirochaetota bacterium]
MKIIALNCSPRKEKSTHLTLQKMKEKVAEVHPEVEVEVLDLAGKEINGCRDCDYCRTRCDCAIRDDFTTWIPFLKEKAVAGLIIATPVYLGSMTSQAKAFLDRSVLFRRNGFLWKNKIGGVIAIGGSRNGGQEITIQAVQAAFFIHDMIVVSDGTHYGGTLWSRIDGGIENDQIGLETAAELGLRVVEIAKKMTG